MLQQAITQRRALGNRMLTMLTPQQSWRLMACTCRPWRAGRQSAAAAP